MPARGTMGMRTSRILADGPLNMKSSDIVFDGQYYTLAPAPESSENLIYQNLDYYRTDSTSYEFIKSVIVPSNYLGMGKVRLVVWYDRQYGSSGDSYIRVDVNSEAGYEAHTTEWSWQTYPDIREVSAGDEIKIYAKNTVGSGNYTEIYKLLLYGYNLGFIHAPSVTWG